MDGNTNIGWPDPIQRLPRVDNYGQSWAFRERRKTENHFIVGRVRHMSKPIWNAIFVIGCLGFTGACGDFGFEWMRDNLRLQPGSFLPLRYRISDWIYL